MTIRITKTHNALGYVSHIFAHKVAPFGESQQSVFRLLTETIRQNMAMQLVEAILGLTAVWRETPSR